jgi:hypothetical protein
MQSYFISFFLNLSFEYFSILFTKQHNVRTYNADIALSILGHEGLFAENPF